MSEAQAPQHKRHLKNWLLQPLLQVRLGLYSILLAVIFSFVVSSILYVNLKDFTEIIITLTDSESEVRQIFHSYISNSKWWLVLVVIAYLLTNVAISILFTHRLIGPTIQFRNHVERLRRGQFDSRIYLRRGDAFVELADELNLLSKELEEGHGKIQPSDRT